MLLRPEQMGQLLKLNEEAIRAADSVVAYDWGTSVPETYHFERIAAMDRLRAALGKLRAFTEACL